jgi:hypothetical protein
MAVKKISRKKKRSVKKISGKLVVEVTRWCNMYCDHCLRGCAENINISKRIIRNALDAFEDIQTLTITGGEPSLVPELIKYIVDYIIANNISLGCIYIVTNGKKYSRSMINTMRRAYAYAYEKELCALCVSVDAFHDGTHKENYYRYADEIFFRKDKEQPNLERYLINEGNAYENGIGRRNLNVPVSIEKDATYCWGNTLCISEDLIYVNALGGVLLDCDVSYRNQNLYEIGNLNDSSLVDIIMSHIE